MKIYEVTNETKIAAFALGRLNPATIGHELLVNAIKQAPQPVKSFKYIDKLK